MQQLHKQSHHHRSPPGVCWSGSHARPIGRRLSVSCASSTPARDVSVSVASVVTETTTTADAAAVAPPRVETAPPPQQPQQQPPPQPYRVTDTTINDIKAFHKSQLSEYDYIVQDAWVEGTIPQELVGTYLRNGPGMQTAGRHTFDGDGQIVAFSFDGSGRVRFTNKFVRTRGFLDEQAAGRPVHRTAFTRGAADGSLLFNPFDMQMKNVANTGVLHWGNKLLALYESNLPYELDATSLNTYGECDMGGQLHSPVLAAHYRVMPGRQQLQHQQQQWGSSSNGSSNGAHAPSQQQQQEYGVQQSVVAAPDGRTFVGFSFNSDFASGGADMIFYEFSEDGALRHSPQHYTLPGVPIALIHDIAVTEDYYVITLGPIDFSLPKFVTQYMTSRCSIAECMEYKPHDKPTQVHLVPRPGGKAAGTAPYVINTPAMFVFHHVNAFQVPPASSGSNGSGSNGGDNGVSSNGSNGGSNGSNGVHSGSSTASSGKQLLVLDTVGWSEISFENSQHNLTTDYYKGGTRPQLQRLVFELDPPNKPSGNNNNKTTSSSGRFVSRQQLVSRTMEFPCVNWDMHGRPHSHIYCCADTVNDSHHWGPTQSVLKVSFGGNNSTQADDPQTAALKPTITQQLWDAGRRRYVCEPLFVPRPNPSAEDDGWVLAILHNAESDKGELVILDAQRVGDGPLATIRLPHHLAAGLHGSFSPQVLLRGWEEAAGRAWTEANVVRGI